MSKKKDEWKMPAEFFKPLTAEEVKAEQKARDEAAKNKDASYFKKLFGRSPNKD